MPPRQNVVTWKNHKETWSKCQNCDLCKTRNVTVLCRGLLPCDVLFIGEAPGTSENVLGRPFVGAAGSLLDYLIETAERATGRSVRLRKAFTNLVACIPVNTDNESGRYRDPTLDEVTACSLRLNEFVKLARPRALVMLGTKTQKLAPKMIDYDFEYSLDLIHPATIVHADVSQQGLAIQKTVVCLRDLFLQLGTESV
jgi:uracil-DNA glycosylase family 4